MTKIDLKDTTFIIPVKIESEDRLRNVVTICCFLLENFDTKVILKEVDRTSVFKERALPQISDFLEGSIDNLIHIHDVPELGDPVFYRMRYLNEMLSMVDTKVVANYDCDVLLPLKTYSTAQEMCMDEYDLVYPYGQGIWQKQVFATDEMVSDFLSNDSDFTFLDRDSNMYDAQCGHVQFFKTSSYIEGGMENENFQGSSPEDKERIYRFEKLGYNVGRIDKLIYHLEHSRGINSWPNSYAGNPHMERNLQLWEDLQKLSPDGLRNYYSNQKYLKKYT